jgi:delta 1-pyrroline-5-carboxylate dehydrogenase
MVESADITTTTDEGNNTSNSSNFDTIVDKDLKLDKLLLEAVQTIKQMHELKMEIKTKENEFDEDKTRLLKSMYLTLHTQKLSNFNEILKAVEEIMR